MQSDFNAPLQQTESTSTSDQELEVLVAVTSLGDLIDQYEEDQPEDDGAKPRLLNCQAEAFVFCHSIALTAPVNASTDDHILKSLQEEAAVLRDHVPWQPLQSEPEHPQPQGSGISSPTSSPPKKKSKTRDATPDPDGSPCHTPPAMPHLLTARKEFVNQRQSRSHSRRRRPQKHKGTGATPNSAAALSPTSPMPHTQDLDPTPKNARSRRHEQRRQDPKFIAQKTRWQIQRCLDTGSFLVNPNFNIHNASVTKTGWTGLTMMKPSDQKSMRKLFESGEVWDVLSGFKKIPYQSHQPLLVFDQSGHLLVARAFQADWVLDEMPQLDALLKDLVGDLPKETIWSTYANNPRGNHVPFLLGWHRQYTKKPTLTQQHRISMERTTAFINSPLIRRLTKYVCDLLRLYFPECAARYEHAVQYWKKHGVDCYFDLFLNFCPNIPLNFGAGRVHTLPHADRKNIAGGICILMAYHRNKSFNSHLTCWLVIWELGIIIELPVGVVLLYPSALFYHFNIDISDLELIATDGTHPNITDRDQYPKWDNEAEGRGSLVWFNQASMIQSAELGFLTINAAKQAGLDGTTNFSSDADRYFTPAAPFQSAPFTNI